ncbi:hypothetical protein Q6A83_07940 [Aliarcobacter skirrowii]|uniref:hypothetical protein n=1 Tax=Aliarcobacter skirrowii TaxID=28200 RepID=UPI0029B9306B|nr:hypothetical protein [Aliarcobacter skirrowii]MDX4050699.1 hypothetical protein [Aliarcobacter skirrowii]
MPQLIAMIIIVVGAMIYMFQTFGGTGDKITGVAQKTSVITEIQNIKTGLQFAARDGVIYANPGTDTDKFNTLSGLAGENYFAEQINNQITKLQESGNTLSVPTELNKNNIYTAISFGGSPSNLGGMLLSLVTVQNKIPGIYVDLGFTGSSLSDTAGFLESQIENDLKGIAYIDRHALSPTAGTTTTNLETELGKNTADKLPGFTGTSTNSDKDGKFIIYFYDFASSELVK